MTTALLFKIEIDTNADDHAFDRTAKRSPYTSREAYAKAIRRALENIHATPIRAEYDAAGNCIYCGECGRCPGYHAVKSIGGF